MNNDLQFLIPKSYIGGVAVRSTPTTQNHHENDSGNSDQPPPEHEAEHSSDEYRVYKPSNTDQSQLEKDIQFINEQLDRQNGEYRLELVEMQGKEYLKIIHLKGDGKTFFKPLDPAQIKALLPRLEKQTGILLNIKA